MVRALAVRSGMWRLAIFPASALWLASSADAAQMSVSSNGGPPLITITGEFDFSDVVKFLRKTEGN
jgi:hypothetical protein